jgi:hypothetical protein
MLFISQEEAWHVLRWFWPNICPSPHALDDRAREFAQDVLLQAITRSSDSAYVNARFETFYLRTDRGTDRVRRAIDMIAQRVANRAPRQCLPRTSPIFLQDLQIQESVRSTIARERSSDFQAVLQTS